MCGHSLICDNSDVTLRSEMYHVYVDAKNYFPLISLPSTQPEGCIPVAADPVSGVTERRKKDSEPLRMLCIVQDRQWVGNIPANSTMRAATYTISFLSHHHDPYLSPLGLLHIVQDSFT